MSQSPIAADDAELRSDVRRLGDLLGQTLVRQEGPELLALVEEVRKAVREGSGEEILAQLSVEDSVQLVRAFSTYFHLANVAEQVHRARVLAQARVTGGSWLARAVDRIEAALKAQTPGHELTKEESKLDFISSLKNLKINHILQKDNLDYYHRTKQLNEMLNIVKTPVVVNYDIDVILPVDSYVESQNLILNGNSDFVYPYGDGEFQREISLSFNRDEFNINFDINSIDTNLLKTFTSKYGHCVFANTKKYRKCGGENENFIGYGPEDQERENRFITLKYNVSRVDNLVYHFEHSRTPFSNGDNKYYDKNHKLCDKLLAMDYKSMLDYYNNIEYREKYDKFN